MIIDCNNIQTLSWEVLVKLLAGVSTAGCAAVRIVELSSAPVVPGMELRDDGGVELRDDGGIELRD